MVTPSSNRDSFPRLLAVVEVDKDDRIVCQAEGCGHAVYKRIHVVRDNDRITVLGSECFKRLYGGSEHVTQTPMFGSSEGRRLSEEERAALRENTERLIAALEAEHIAAERAKEARRLKTEQEAAERANASTRRSLSPNRPHGVYGRSAANRAGPVIDLLVGVSDSELAKIRAEARVRMQAENPSVNIDSPGWLGLIEAEVRRILRQRRNGPSSQQ